MFPEKVAGLWRFFLFGYEGNRHDFVPDYRKFYGVTFSC